MLAIFWQFFLLGLMSFGGPAAHIGYFKKRFVDELNWLDANTYASFVALSQVLPGPSSSQVGFSIGHFRGGLAGGLAAFIGFTLPSFLLLTMLAVSSTNWLGASWFQGLLHGLKLMAVVIVADAVSGMFKLFCRQTLTRLIMLLGAVIILGFASLWAQLLLLFVAAVIGAYFLSPKSFESGASQPALPPLAIDFRWLFIFALLFLLSLFWLTIDVKAVQLFAQFYHAGALVFGGGHVVLPLLEMSVGQEISSERFLAGYAFAQAVPGPMFTLAAFLGAESWADNPILGALVATLAIFLSGFLLLLSALKSWHGLMASAKFRGAIAGINAAVVGLLLAALITPVITSAIFSLVDLLLVILGLWLSKRFRLNILWLVLGYVVVGLALGFTG
ncbi:chromate efflux transporter [Shewanella mesophila]|uniref:chromate efflux transporter n=1 Tax=Shewanella mesophila TaxID=2864208 RepID=UPI001C66078E|nr:chromate efflux transporter [Shewanella mesophila]QYJ88095.1 chromate efflux transporter [Shewanella mesophila]